MTLSQMILQALCSLYDSHYEPITSSCAMRPSRIVGALLTTNVHTAIAGIYDQWIPPGPNDLRGPCPMLNTLANHGFLPRDGRHFTENVVLTAFDAALNFDPAFSLQAFNTGLKANPEPNATYFDLAQLSKHNVLEKDASLTRVDAYFGDARIFNESILQRTMQWWTARHLNMITLANSKIARQLESRRDNPTYYYSQMMEGVGTGELASLFAVFGNENRTKVDRDLLEYWFRHERLPTSLGWQRPARVYRETMSRLQDEVAEAVILTTEKPEKSTVDEK